MHKFSGFTDEASPEIDRQIEVLRTLGWSGIETRLVGPGKHFDDIDDDEFQRIHEKLQRAGVRIVCYGSQIANWSRKITGDLSLDIEELKRILPRMKMTGTRLVRVMSYPNDGLSEKDWRKEAVRRLRELCQMAAEAGAILAHENCSGYGSDRERTRILLEELHSPAFKLIFDPGNVVQHDPQGDALTFFRAVRSEIVHVHIKDYAADPASREGTRACFAGEGLGRIAEMVSLLKKDGYDGWYTMEPHLSAAAHEGRSADPAQGAIETFIEYSKRFEALFARA
jgi:sugar phosphate isomerase/epimerase